MPVITHKSMREDDDDLFGRIFYIIINNIITVTFLSASEW